MSDALSALDATFLELEQENGAALMSIGGVMVFDPLPEGGVPTVEELRADLAGRLGLLPKYSRRLSSVRVGRLSRPHWVDDDRFSLDQHVRHAALPAPGGKPELCEWAADFYSHPLDRTRPLWEIVLVEGLSGGRWALAHKMHHCLVDGVGSVGVVELLLDVDPGQRGRHPTAGFAPEPRTLLQSILGEAPEPIGQAAQAGLHAAHSGLHGALHPRAALRRSRALAGLLLRDEVIAAPRTSINAPIGSARRFTAVTVPLADARTIRSALGGSVNDVVLAACTTGLRLLLQSRGDQLPIRGLRAMVPMNVRQDSEPLTLGNRVSSLFVELPVAEPMAAARHRRIVTRTRQLKSSDAAGGANALLDLAALAPPVVHALFARSLYADRLFNVTITNVPGPQVPLYAMGAQLRELYPVVPLAADHAVGIATFSYNGLLTFGVIADAESTPDIAVLADGIAQGLDELLTLAGVVSHKRGQTAAPEGALAP